MTNQYVWIGIAVGVFFVGIAGGYAIFLNTYQPDQMLTQTQLMQQMMNDPDLRNEMMTMMMQNPEMMQAMMQNQQMMQMIDPNMKEEIIDLYNKDLNPRQIEHPNHLGFNDLHIEAINHLIPSDDDSVLDMIVHHQCKVYDDMTASCMLFPTGMSDQDKPFGMEYVIGADDYAGLTEEEKKYWHYHKTELPKVNATLPDLTAEEAEPLMSVLNETYGKVVYFWQIGDQFPTGEPFIVNIKELYERNSP